MESTQNVNYSYIGDNLSRIREECASIADRLGVASPTVVAVTKSATDEEVRALVSDYGQAVIAENRTSMFRDRYALFSDAERPEIHLIGSLQTNKVKYIVRDCALIHSLDSLRLAREIDRRAASVGVRARVLVEINSAREEAKGGILPEEAEAFLLSLSELSCIEVKGLMTMGPVLTDQEEYRPYFRLTADLYRDFCEKGYFKDDPVLSMGMSDSYSVAIEEGATLVRIGRALFRK